MKTSLKEMFSWNHQHEWNVVISEQCLQNFLNLWHFSTSLKTSWVNIKACPLLATVSLKLLINPCRVFGECGCTHVTNGATNISEVTQHWEEWNSSEKKEHLLGQSKI